MLEFEKCCCYQCSCLNDADSSPDCACDNGPVYSQSQCMDCPKRHFCDVTKQPQLYLEESPSASHNKQIMPCSQVECGKCIHVRVCPAIMLLKNSGVDMQINGCIYYSAKTA